MTTAQKPSLIPEDAFETGAPEGTLGAEEELWLADPETLKLASGAQKILTAEPEDRFSGELIDCEIEANTGVHPDPGYARCADLLVTFEGRWADYLGATVPAWTAGQPPGRFCHLVYEVPGGSGDGSGGRVARTAAARGAAVHCAVPGGLPNPWRTAPGPADHGL